MSDQTTPKPDLSAPLATMDSTPSSDKPNKRQKVAIACDVCRAKKVKCDSVRPVCGPCSKRQHGAPCEYTTVTRTSHGPTKGYVHHLELKLRELQAGRELQDGRELRDSIGTDRGRGSDSSLQEQRSITTKSPLSEPPPASRQRSSYDQLSSNNWGTPIQWQQRPPEESGRPSLSVGPPSASSARDPLANGTGTPSMVSDRRPDTSDRPRSELPFNGFNGRPINDGPINSPLVDHRPVNDRSITDRSVVDRPVSDRPVIGLSVSDRPSSFMNQLKESAMDSKRENGIAPTSPPVIEPPTLSTTIRKRPRSVDYILPSRKTADGLMEAYWETAHALFPIIDYETFNMAYQAIWSGSPIENEQQIMCTLNVIFALASSFTESLDVKQRLQSADIFFDRAQDLFEMDLWNASGQSIESIQSLLLICQYLQSRSATSQGWTFIGLAMSMAESLGLHLHKEGGLSERQKRLHQMTWHGCLYMKRTLAMNANRPSMIEKPTINMVNKPFKHLLNIRPEQLHFFHSLLLSEILDEILQQTYTWKGLIRENAIYELTHETVLASVSQLDGQLSRWRNELPAQLLQVSHPHGSRTPRQRQANNIRLQYYNARILLFRPTLLRWVRLQINPQDPVYSEAFQAQTSLTCSTLCLHSSLDMIEFIYTRLPNFEMQNNPAPSVPATSGPNIHANGPNNVSGTPDLLSTPNPTSLLPAWWDVISYLHTAALVLLASRLNRTLCLSVPHTTLEDAFNTAIYCQRSFAKYGSPLAATSLGALERLAQGTERARMDFGAENVGPPPLKVAELEQTVRTLEWLEAGVYVL